MDKIAKNLQLALMVIILISTVIAVGIEMQNMFLNQSVTLADLLLIFDGPMHTSGKPTLVFGNRGIATLTLTTYGPLKAQHSGHYGNYVPNPALLLAKVLASMKDDKGRVVIPYFYKGVNLDKATKKVLEEVNQVIPESQIQRNVNWKLKKFEFLKIH